jgi:ribosomal protein S18 acetylase RimI-like enzyme
VKELTLNCRRNSASAAQILELFSGCGEEFNQRLCSSVDVFNYVDKLLLRAELFEAWKDSVLVGCVAVYCNDPLQHIAFISNVSVLEQFQRIGIATLLINSCLAYLRLQKFQSVELEVARVNEKAFIFYTKLGFIEKRKTNISSFMFLGIN